jgi:23S rRNA (uracil1939-C5)-methyltransferase
MSAPLGDTSVRDAPAPATIATIDALNHDGRGVARVDGKVTFVDGALPGETVRLRYLKKRSRYDQAAITEILAPSPDRVTPRCPHFGVCGGCSLQHLDSAAQLAAKQRVLADALAHLGNTEPQAWLPPLRGPVWGYRRRARLGARLVPKKGGVLLGFRERRRSFIANLTECPVLAPPVSALLPGLRALIEGFSRPDRVPQVEVAIADNAVALVFRHLVPLTAGDRSRLGAFAAAHGVQVYAQGDGPDSIVPIAPVQPEALFYRLPGRDLSIYFGPADFVQVNREVNERMVRQALDLLDLRPTDRVLDLFCGLGNFTLPLARSCAQALGIESDAAAVARARDNAAINNIANAEFRLADLYDDGPTVAPWGTFGFDKLLLDPPRTGAMAVIRRLAPPLPTHIVYVSCSPATLARDAAHLVHALGYRLARAGVLDMFPHTSHVESIALFTLV